MQCVRLTVIYDGESKKLPTYFHEVVRSVNWLSPKGDSCEYFEGFTSHTFSFTLNLNKMRKTSPANAIVEKFMTRLVMTSQHVQTSKPDLDS